MQAAGWTTTHFALGHDIMHCIVTQGAQQARMDKQQGPRYGRDTATIRPRHATIRSACAQGKWRAHEGLATGGLCRDTNGRIVTGARIGRWVVLRDSRDTVKGSAAIRRRGRATRHPMQRYGA